MMEANNVRSGAAADRGARPAGARKSSAVCAFEMGPGAGRRRACRASAPPVGSAQGALAERPSRPLRPLLTEENLLASFSAAAWASSSGYSRRSCQTSMEKTYSSVWGREGGIGGGGRAFAPPGGWVYEFCVWSGGGPRKRSPGENDQGALAQRALIGLASPADGSGRRGQGLEPQVFAQHAPGSAPRRPCRSAAAAAR